MSASLALTLRRLNGPSQKKAYTGTAGVIDNQLPQGTSAVMVWTDSAAYVAVVTGTDVATTTSCPLPASVPVVLPVEMPSAPGSVQNFKVSAVQVSAGGTLYVQPLAD